ncbi:MAG: transporter substrate-binding domain-containing protein [Actinobacteria bacterium]|nr:transporter substrate-binding domain-containing protein [Actinomycetota bacterium]
MRAGERVIKSLRWLVAMAIVGLGISLPISALAQSSPTAKTESTSSAKPVLRVAVKKIEPFVVIGADGTHSGFSIDLLKDISDEVGFDIQYVDVESVGAQLSAVSEGRADLAIGAISITSAREKTVDFSASMFESGIQTMIPSGSGSISGSKIFSDIFSSFLLIILGLMLVGSVLTGIFVWAWERRHGNDQFTNSGAHGVFDGIWWATVTLFTIGYGDKVPHKVVSRIVTMVWMFVGVLLVATITAQVTSKLTVDRLESNISSVEDLSGKKVISYPGTTSWEYLQKHGIEAQPVDNIETAYQEVRSGKADAFVFDASIVQWLVANRGGVKVAGQIIQFENYGIVMAQGSSLTEPINQALLHLREDGTYERLKKSYFS